MGAIKIGGFGDEREGTAPLDGFEQRRGAFAEAEDAGVFRRAVRIGEIAGEIQQGVGAQAGEPRMRVAFGFDGLQKRFAGGAGLRGGEKAVFQAFVHAVQRGEILRGGGAQAVKERLREGFFLVDEAVLLGGLQQIGRRDGGQRGGQTALRQRRTDGGCAGQGGERRVVVAAAPALDGHGNDFRREGLQVFQRKGGVGLGEQIGGEAGNLFGGQRAGAGIGQAVRQTRLQGGGKSRGFRFEERRGGGKQRERRRFAAEGEMCHHAEGGEQRNAAGSEIRRGGAGEAGWQLKHNIRAVFQRRARAQPLIMPGERAALALEYLQALPETIVPVPVARRGSGYHDASLSALSSATAVRAALARGDLPDALSAVPSPEALRAAEESGFVHEEEALTQALLYRLRTARPDELAALYGMDEGLENRFLFAARTCSSRETLLDAVKTRRYTRARLSRLCAYTLLNLTRDFADANRTPDYARVLGFRKSAAPLLKAVKQHSAIPLITKAADFDRDRKNFALDVLAQDLWSLGVLNPSLRTSGRDFTTSPVIL